jgi:hypothetical protein
LRDLKRSMNLLYIYYRLLDPITSTLIRIIVLPSNLRHLSPYSPF